MRRKTNGVITLIFALALAYAHVDRANAAGGDHDTQYDGDRDTQLGSDQGPPPGAAPLSEAQRSCMEGKLGKPGEGTPPTREDFEAAAKSCNLPIPANPDRES